MPQEPDTDLEFDLEKDPLAFYRRKRRVPEDMLPSTTVFVVGGTLAFGLIVLLLGAVVWLCLHKDTTITPFIQRHTGATLNFHDSTGDLPHYASNDQKLRLTEASVVSVEGSKIFVTASGERTTVLIDDQTKIWVKGPTLPPDQYQRLMNLYTQQTQFAKPGILYIPPEPFSREPSTVDAIHFDDALVITPTADSPDGETVKAESILIDR